MHEFTPEVEALAAEILKYSLERLKDDPPLDGPRSAEGLFNEVGNTITAKGLGGHDALAVFTNVLAKACISTDHPRNLAFICFFVINLTIWTLTCWGWWRRRRVVFTRSKCAGQEGGQQATG